MTQRGPKGEKSHTDYVIELALDQLTNKRISKIGKEYLLKLATHYQAVDINDLINKPVEPHHVEGLHNALLS